MPWGSRVNEDCTICSDHARNLKYGDDKAAFTLLPSLIKEWEKLDPLNKMQLNVGRENQGFLSLNWSIGCNVRLILGAPRVACTDFTFLTPLFRGVCCVMVFRVNGSLVCPFYAVMKQESKATWTSFLQFVWDQLKTTLETAPVLLMADRDKGSHETLWMIIN